jgi:succinyl-CoA synthetase beta subunit
VNPLLVTKSRDVVALDAKVTVDGNALYRHSDTAAFRAVGTRFLQMPLGEVERVEIDAVADSPA